MKERILTRWTFQRGLFAVVGLVIVIQSIVAKEWLNGLFGGYFLSMGLFSFGCASGGCFTGNCNLDSRIDKKDISGVQFDEIKK